MVAAVAGSAFWLRIGRRRRETVHSGIAAVPAVRYSDHTCRCRSAPGQAGTPPRIRRRSCASVPSRMASAKRTRPTDPSLDRWGYSRRIGCRRNRADISTHTRQSPGQGTRRPDKHLPTRWCRRPFAGDRLYRSWAILGSMTPRRRAHSRSGSAHFGRLSIGRCIRAPDRPGKASYNLFRISRTHFASDPWGIVRVEYIRR